MSKIDITRTELVWPGKYDEEGNLVPPRRVSLPFQVIERVSETRATRQKREADKKGHVATLFDYWQEEKAQPTDSSTGWRNKLIWGDNLYVMGSLLEKFAGKIDLIYIDPPFATGVDFSVTSQIGEEEEISKEQSIIEEKVYRDTWGNGIDSYIDMIYERSQLINQLLKDDGTFYLHCDARMVHYVKCILDSVFGREKFQCQIIWKRINSGRKARSYKWISVDDIILMYRKGGNKFESQYMPYSEEYKKRFKFKDDRGWYFWDNIGAYSQERLDKLVGEDRIRFPKNPNAKPRMKNYLEEGKGVIIDNIWTDIPPVNSQAGEDTGYDTQKPEPLLERLIRASSNENDIVADFFCGSGTTLKVAEKLGRRWIGCDLGRYGIHTSRKRLMEIPDCKPFEILNLGRYERQVWQGITFDGKKQTQQMLIFEYLKFILELYGAQPLAGTQVLHGKKGSTVVHVGAVDAPVTIDEVIACLTECKQMGQKELHILGWEWEMGLANLMVDEAKSQGIKLLMLTIPREVMEQQAVDKGDIHFYELAYLEPKIELNDKKVTVSLADFVIPNDELIPPEVRQMIKKWSDYVDYWAVDWDFQNDAFVNGWTSYRTRKDRTLQLNSEVHEYPAAGKYRIVVKVIDIFGNDTSQVFEVEVK